MSSTLDLIENVINEIHDCDKFLLSDDTPDRKLFERIKSLWQLLLGIDESKFDSYNYEYFELTFENDNSSFSGFSYFGPNLPSSRNNAHNGIGSSHKSLKIIELLEKDETENLNETSISFKLSVLNKLRYILFQHHIILEDIFSEESLVDKISTYIRNDVLSTKTELSISLKCNNNVFQSCYVKCLQLLFTDDSYTIDDATSRVINLFTEKYNVAYFFDLPTIIKFQNQIITLVKRSFKNHPNVVDEIDDFYKHNPILPILKPIYRKQELQSITREIKSDIVGIEDIDGSSALLANLNCDLLIKILNEVTHCKITNEDDMPITMKWFPEIIKYYCESLREDDSNNIESDLYVMMIKKVAILWVEKNIDTSSFITKLCDLSLIPTAMPYIYNGTQFPTVHMRMALYMVKENIRLCETYFDQWKYKLALKLSLNGRDEHYQTYILKRYFDTWKTKTQKVKQLEIINTDELKQMKLKKESFNLWRDKFLILSDMEQKADIKYTRKYFSKWNKKLLIEEGDMNKALIFYNTKTETKYWNVWIFSKQCRFTETIIEFEEIQLHLYFDLLLSLYKQIKYNDLKAKKINVNNTTKLYFKIWKQKAKKSLNKINKMQQLESRFPLKLCFEKWKNHIELINKEKIFYLQSKKITLQVRFEHWYKLKKLIDAEHIFLYKSNNQLALSYLGKWNNTYQMNKKAVDFYNTNLLIKQMNNWLLKLKRNMYKQKHNENILQDYMKLWKLKIIELDNERKTNEYLLNSHFIKWFHKSSSIHERLFDCENSFSIIKTAAYFDFWKTLCKKTEKNNILATEFKEQKDIKKKILLLKYIFETIKLKYSEARFKKIELKRRDHIFQAYLLKKYLYKLIIQKQKYDIQNIQADEFYKSGVKHMYFEIWLVKFDKVLELQNILNIKRDTDNVELLTQILSSFQLKMIKVKTDLTNADNFKKRWNKIKTKTFFDLWKLKMTSRQSPTPTARTVNNNKKDSNIIPELNPYIDLAPRARGSPVYRSNYQSNMRSVLTGDSSKYHIEQQINNNENTIFEQGNLTPTRFRTPTVRKSSSRLSNISASSMRYNSENSNIFTSAERVRKKNLEERLLRYKLLRSPPKNQEFNLSNVEESQEDNSDIIKDNSIFDSSIESDDTTTPIKNNEPIEI